MFADGGQNKIIQNKNVYMNLIRNLNKSGFKFISFFFYLILFSLDIFHEFYFLNLCVDSESEMQIIDHKIIENMSSH